MNTVILLVEDDAVIRNNLSSLLQQEEFQTIACSSLEEARGTLLHRVPDLAVLDVLLLDGSGFDLCREIRASYKIPILFLTCCDEDEDTIKGLECGGDDYGKAISCQSADFPHQGFITSYSNGTKLRLADWRLSF